MENEITLEEFLHASRISKDEWDASKCDWAVLEAIAKHFEHQRSELDSTGQLVANILQKIPEVHSVRWRVKDSCHLLAKIVRKCLEENPQEKYLKIDVANYMNNVTDLIGVRALHLFKDECFAISAAIHERLNIEEGPVAYIRNGDDEDFKSEFELQNFEVKDHKSGYRSVHYVVSSQPFKKIIKVEIQVRTIFEEGWSEIDHRVRYPDYSDNELLSYFLAIFNRLAGSADEMGSHAKVLSKYLNEYSKNLENEKNEKEKSLLKMESAVRELEKLKSANQESSESIQQLKNEITRLRGTAPSFHGGGGLLSSVDREYSRGFASPLLATLPSLEELKPLKDRFPDSGQLFQRNHGIDDPEQTIDRIGLLETYAKALNKK